MKKLKIKSLTQVTRKDYEKIKAIAKVTNYTRTTRTKKK